MEAPYATRRQFVAAVHSTDVPAGFGADPEWWAGDGGDADEATTDRRRVMRCASLSIPHYRREPPQASFAGRVRDLESAVLAGQRANRIARQRLLDDLCCAASVLAHAATA
jgi:hypothetical protein